MPAPLTSRVPAPPVVGLLASAAIIDEPDLRWGGAGGWSWSPFGCDVGVVLDPCNPDTFTPPARPDPVQGNAFAVTVGDTCSTMDYGGNFADLQARARALLAAVRSKRIAREFWYGTQARESNWDNQYLTNIASSDTVTDGASSATVALACLEEYLADCAGGGQGMIHATRQTVTHWAGLDLVRREAGRTLTINDTIVVADAGYDGSGPALDAAPVPPADGSIWAYATSLVEVRLGPVQDFPSTESDLRQVVDPSTNDYLFVAQQLAAVTFDPCCHAAAELDLPLCGIGGAGS